MQDTTKQTVEEKLVLLYKLQTIDSKIDEIRRLRGDVPQKVRELEDEIVGLNTRIKNLENSIETIKNSIKDNEISIAEATDLIKKYEEQRENVRNNREYDALTREIEYQKTDISLREKRIKEFNEQLKLREQELEEARKELEEKQQELEEAKKELEEVMKDTEKEEQELLEMRKKIEEQIEERILRAYNRIRRGVRNGLAVVPITESGACGGCYNMIPPQRQLEVSIHKKILNCEFCGRILVDDSIVEKVKEELKF